MIFQLAKLERHQHSLPGEVVLFFFGYTRSRRLS